MTLHYSHHDPGDESNVGQEQDHQIVVLRAEPR